VANVKIEFIRLGEGIIASGSARNVISECVQSLAAITTSGTATAPESRPAAPSSLNKLYARVTTDAPVYLAWGADPTASATSGIKLLADIPEVISISPGQLISLVDA
jgi:hypothetical protein